MNTKRTTASRRGVKLVGAACAAAAVVGAGVLTVILDDGGSPHATLAGSGDAPASTIYTQPSVSAMTMGATATFTTPSSVEPTTEAAPPIKAGS